MINISLDLPDLAESAIKYTLDLFKRHYNLSYQVTQQRGELHISSEPDADIQISSAFIKALSSQDFSWQSLMPNEPLIRTSNDKPDYLSTCFYMVNCLQEKNQDVAYDTFGRFKYEASYQCAYDCIEENLVLKYFEEFGNSIPVLSSLRKKPEVSRLFVTHDIDYLVKGIWPDLKTAVARFKLSTILKLFLTEIWQDQDRKLFEKILSINNAHDVRAVFFWMVNNKKYRVEKEVIFNANYSIKSAQTQRFIHLVEERNHDIGLHKSLGSRSYTNEKIELNREVLINRNHYLHGSIFETWKRSEAAGLVFDASLGFSNQIGFRNSYGMPFRPFNWDTGQARKIIEIPLNVMDVTLMRNHRLKPDHALDQVKDFLGRNRYDCILSVLWHNNYFSEHKFADWIEVYKGILEGGVARGFRAISLSEIMQMFSD